MAAGALWRMPGRFGFVRILGRAYDLRCVVFHNIAATESPFTSGIRVSVTPEKFESALKFLTAHYVPVSLQDVITDCEGKGLPQRAVLVTFDDAYASVSESAAPLCRRYGVPAVFFVNAAFLDNQRMAPDNLLCYVANVLGMETVNAAVRAVPGKQALELHSLPEVFDDFLPAISLTEREVFLDALRQLSGINESRMAKDANLYLTGKQIRELTSCDFEIGNHTHTHTHGRTLLQQDFASEVDRNKAELEALSGTKVRSFSVPYGSSKDLTPELAEHLERTGHEAVFLSESVANSRGADLSRMDRISTLAEEDGRLFLEIEVLPRLRAIRNRLFRNPAPISPGRTVSSTNPQVAANLVKYIKASDGRNSA
jgi:peptidoglycan/xylan/chitin deacetylase (PgdA/CDA1 family)